MSGSRNNSAGDRSTVDRGSKRRTTVNNETKQGLAKQIVRLPYYFSALVIAVSLIYCSILSGGVEVIMPSQPGLKDAAYYNEQLSQSLGGSLFHYSKLTFNPRAYKARAMSTLPEVSDMVVRLPLVGHKPVVNIAFVTPSLLLTSNSKQYVVSSDGMVLAEAATVSPAKLENLIVITEDVPLKLAVGRPALTSESARFIQEVVTELRGSDAEIESLRLPLGASELHVRIKNEQYYIKFASETGSGAKQQVGAYLAVINSLKGQAQLPLEYIDVRLGERVFVK